VARLEPDEARWRVSTWLCDHLLAERVRRVVLGPLVFRADPRHGPQDDTRVLDEFRFGRWVVIDRTRRDLDQGESRGGVRGAPVERAAPSHTKAADTADAASEKTWFAVKLVDEFGKGIDGLEVVFSQGSRRETLETDGNGVARCPSRATTSRPGGSRCARSRCTRLRTPTTRCRAPTPTRSTASTPRRS
jgi:hypothetical protein